MKKLSILVLALILAIPAAQGLVWLIATYGHLPVLVWTLVIAGAIGVLWGLLDIIRRR